MPVSKGLTTVLTVIAMATIFIVPLNSPPFLPPFGVNFCEFCEFSKTRVISRDKKVTERPVASGLSGNWGNGK